MRRPSIPIYALVDFDPDGIAIMSTYKYGSISLAHENEALRVLKIEWLGVSSQDILISAMKSERSILKLRNRDRRIASGMLARTPFQEGGQESVWRRELQVMLYLNIKAEIQVLSGGSRLESWLDRKLRGI